MTGREPGSTERRIALQSLLQSDAFSRSERLRAFLTYVVEKDLAGEAQQLKGYTIAIDVFGRGQNFNADSDPLVRVHAGKLRKLLSLYYETEGSSDPWQIAIPKGGYTPVYHARHLAPEAVAEGIELPSAADASPGGEEALSPRKEETFPESALLPVSAQDLPSTSKVPLPAQPMSAPAPVLGAVQAGRALKKPSPFAALSILPLMMLLPLSSTAMSVHVPSAPLAPSGIVASVAGELPHLHLKVPEDSSRIARQFSFLLSLAFSQYRTVNAAPHPRGEAAGPAAPSEKLSFDVRVDEVMQPSGLKITVASSQTGEVVSSTFIAGHQQMNENDLLFESLEIAGETLTPDGAIFRYAAEKQIETHLMRCMRLTDDFRVSRNRESFRLMRDCQQQLIPGPDGKMIFAVSAGALPKAVSDSN